MFATSVEGCSSMKNTYKSFHKQYTECKNSGMMKEIDCPSPFSSECPKRILLCIKYMEVCRSSVCQQERFSNG